MNINNTKFMQGSILLAGILLTLLTACGGGSSGTTPPVSTPVVPTPTAVGVASGVPVSATIGAAGGSVGTPDGKVALNIPAGALAADTVITIQPITNKAHGGMGLGYRLTPDGQTFAQPVELKFAYTDQDLGGSDPEILGAAFQTAEGFWEWFGTPSFDKVAKTVSVNTTHFTDTSMVPGYRLMPLSKTIKVKESLPMQVEFCYAPKSSADQKRLGMKCDNADSEANELPFFMITEWSVNGVLGGNGSVGTISGNGPSATFTAPATMPSPNPVAVSANVNFVGKDKTLVVSNITIIDPTAYEGTVHFTESNGAGIEITQGVASVAWTLFDDSLGVRVYKPTGTISAVVTPTDCDPTTVSTDLSYAGNKMMLYTKSTGIPDTHAFNLQSITKQITFQCGNPRNPRQVPVTLSANVTNCGSNILTQQPITDPAHLTGKYSCAWPGTSWQWALDWDFVAH